MKAIYPYAVDSGHAGEKYCAPIAVDAGWIDHQLGSSWATGINRSHWHNKEREQIDRDVPRKTPLTLLTMHPSQNDSSSRPTQTPSLFSSTPSS